MKKKKSIVFIIIGIIILIAIGVLLFFLLNDKNKLTVTERNWINENISTIQNINVVNNANVFGNNGEGVFYDFLNDFETDYDLSINPITFNVGSTPSGISLSVKESITDNDLVFYKDHYVVVGKTSEVISEDSDLNGKTIGILSNDLSNISTYTKSSNITFSQFETTDELLSAMQDNISYMIVPLTLYLDNILSNNYHIIYHLSDINIYYTLTTDDSTLSKILVKYYNTWEDNFNLSFNKSLFNTFTDSLNITDTEIDAMQSITYNYGFVNASPYEVITGGKYGGIVAVYLSKFSTFADVEFNFVKYKSLNKLEKAIKDKNVDLYFNYYNITDELYETEGISIRYAIVAPKNDNIVIRSINSLKGKEVYVQENSKLYDYVKSNSDVNIKTYRTMKELTKLNRKDTYIILDQNIFNYYANKELDNYSLRYSDYLKDEYNFKMNNNTALYKLLNSYIEVLDENEVMYEGLYNHEQTIKSGSVITNIAEYILIAVIIVIIIVLIILKKSKKIAIAKKIKKDDKMKFIDQLTSLKNRNFLHENISTWNNNTIYPQSIIVIDLNKIHEINDIQGYDEGDKQIKALANILVRTQLDNSEIMRTDGNEFVIYTVGYTQKQITNYIHKLSKEIKKLPYDSGAEFGYSMIMDDIKTIEDALNEATEDMKKQKDSKNEKEGKQA